MSTMQEAAASLWAHYVSDGTSAKLMPGGVKVSTLTLGGEPTQVIEVIAQPKLTSPATFTVPEVATGVGWEGHRVVLRRMGIVLGDSGPIE